MPNSNPPETLELIGRLAFQGKQFGLSCFIFTTWVDALLLGGVYALFAFWMNHAHRENRVIKALVCWLVFASTMHTIVVHGSVINTFCAHFGEYKTIFQIDWYRWFAINGSLVKIQGALYFLWRGYVLIGRKLWLPIIVLPQIALCFASSISIIEVFTMPYGDKVRILIAIVSAFEVLSDTIVTATIAIQLYRSKTGFAATDRLIMRLLFLLAETAAPILASALTVLLIYALLPNSPAQMALAFHPKLNAICVLISLLGKFRIADSYRAEPITFEHRGKTTADSDDSALSGLSGQGKKDGYKFIAYGAGSALGGSGGADAAALAEGESRVDVEQAGGRLVGAGGGGQDEITVVQDGKGADYYGCERAGPGGWGRISGQRLPARQGQGAQQDFSADAGSWEDSKVDLVRP